jgi:hypothetical protein
VHEPTECREELNDKFYETLKRILDKLNKNGYMMLIWDMKAKSRK